MGESQKEKFPMSGSKLYVYVRTKFTRDLFTQN